MEELDELRAIFEREPQRVVENVVECTCHGTECTSEPNPYRASTASRSFSAWKWAFNGSINTSM